MTNSPLTASIRKVDTHCVIDLQGEINAQAEDALNQAYTEAHAQGTSVVVLNFTNVDYINSTGIALIVGLLAEARKSHRRLVVYGLSDHYVQIFQITRLSDFMGIYEDEASALES